MDIIQRLYQAENELPKNREQEQKIIDQLFFLVHGRSDHNLPKKFTVRTMLDELSVVDFLRKTLDINVKEIKWLPILVGEGNTYGIFLN